MVTLEHHGYTSYHTLRDRLAGKLCIFVHECGPADIVNMLDKLASLKERWYFVHTQQGMMILHDDVL